MVELPKAVDASVGGWSRRVRAITRPTRTPFFVEVKPRNDVVRRPWPGTTFFWVGRAEDEVGHFRMNVYAWMHGSIFVTQGPLEPMHLHYVGPSVDVLVHRMIHDTWEPGPAVEASWVEQMARLPFGAEPEIARMRTQCAVGAPSYCAEGIDLRFFGPLRPA